MKTILSGTMVVVMIMVGVMFCSTDVVPTAEAAYDHVDQPGPDCIDALMPVPAATVRQFGVKGGSDKVRLVYNISELLKAANTQKARIEALEKQVAELVKLIGEYPSLTPPIDPDDPENTLFGAIWQHTGVINQFRAQIDTNTGRIAELKDIMLTDLKDALATAIRIEHILDPNEVAK